MRITVYYQNGLIDEFDTQNFTEAEPFRGEGKNILTEFQLRLDLMKEEGLLLDVLWHDTRIGDTTNYSFNNDLNVNVAHAARKLGRRIRLVSANELSSIARITKDGELLAWQQGGELIDAVKFTNQEILCFSSASTESINRKAVAIFSYLQKANPSLSRAEIASLMGYTLEAYERIEIEETENIDCDEDLEAEAARLLEGHTNNESAQEDAAALVGEDASAPDELDDPETFDLLDENEFEFEDEVGDWVAQDDN